MAVARGRSRPPSKAKNEHALSRCCTVNAYYMGWFVCPTVNAVRASHSAVDLRTCTDASNPCSMSIEALVGGLMRIFVLKRPSASKDTGVVIVLIEASIDQSLEPGMQMSCPS